MLIKPDDNFLHLSFDHLQAVGAFAGRDGLLDAARELAHQRVELRQFRRALIRAVQPFLQGAHALFEPRRFVKA